MTAIRTIWLGRRLDWHHWRAQRLMHAHQRHFRKYRNLHPSPTTRRPVYDHGNSPAFIEWSKAVDKHVDQYLTRAVEQQQDNEFLR